MFFFRRRKRHSKDKENSFVNEGNMSRVSKIAEIKSKLTDGEITNCYAEKVATEIAELFKSDDTFTPIITMLNELGFVVLMRDMPKESMTGFIMINPELKSKFGSDKIIAITPKESEVRQRFTLAHEFAHYIFDFTGDELSYFDAYFAAHDMDGDLPKEVRDQECVRSRFAAALLMPKQAFTERYNELKSESNYERASALMEEFKVPLLSVKRRIEELGLS